MNREIEMVVAADSDWGIGKSNGMPWPRLKSDLKRFKQITTECGSGLINAVVMGRKTWNSIGNKPLPGRLNVVVSRNPDAVPADLLGAVRVDSLETAVEVCGDSGRYNKIFIMGGGEIYREALKLDILTKIYLTSIVGKYGCDVTIPNLYELGWTVSNAEDPLVENEVTFNVNVLVK